MVDIRHRHPEIEVKLEMLVKQADRIQNAAWGLLASILTLAISAALLFLWRQFT